MRMLKQTITYPNAWLKGLIGLRQVHVPGNLVPSEDAYQSAIQGQRILEDWASRCSAGHSWFLGRSSPNGRTLQIGQILSFSQINAHQSTWAHSICQERIAGILQMTPQEIRMRSCIYRWKVKKMRIRPPHTNHSAIKSSHMAPPWHIVKKGKFIEFLASLAWHLVTIDCCVMFCQWGVQNTGSRPILATVKPSQGGPIFGCQSLMGTTRGQREFRACQSFHAQQAMSQNWEIENLMVYGHYTLGYPVPPSWDTETRPSKLQLLRTPWRDVWRNSGILSAPRMGMDEGTGYES